MKAVRAHIHNGQVVLDEPLDLPEGTAVEVLIPEAVGLASEDPAELEAALQESTEQFDRGEVEDARALAHKLLAPR